MGDLLTSWRAALPTAPTELAARIGADLLGRWGEPHRHYHTVDHLAFVLAVVDEHHGHADDADAVRLAAWYHDAVYDPHRVDNEEASALLAETALPALGVTQARVAEVARLVRLTAGHDPAAGDRNGELLTDADLAVLASPAETYAAYTAAVRREYAHVSDPYFATGRASVLHTLLNLPHLFHVPVLRERWENTARANLSRELQSLRTTPIASF
ncbi:MAG TPA: metal-dependent phosphohydrolase [Micromonosporaceae bacterium]